MELRLHLAALYCSSLAVFCLGSPCKQSLNGLRAVCGDTVSRLFPGNSRKMQTGYGQFVRFLEDSTTQICDKKCSEQIRHVFESCKVEDQDSWEQLKSAWIMFQGKHCELASLRIKRADSSRIFVLSDFDLGNQQCIRIIQSYGDVCYSIFVRVISDIEAFKAIRSIGATCSDNWVKCFIDRGHANGKLDPLLRRLNPDFTRMCEYKCWKKMFDLVMHCVQDHTGAKVSFLSERDRLLNVIEASCYENPLKNVSCGQLAIEFHLTQQEDILHNKTTPCNVSEIKQGQCPSQCYLVMQNASEFLGCCLGNQQHYITFNHLSASKDILGNQTFWNKQHCNISVPDRCPAAMPQHFRNVSSECRAQLQSLDKLTKCTADWYYFQLAVMLTREAGLTKPCQPTGCNPLISTFIESLGKYAEMLCSPECQTHLVNSLQACSVELENASSSALIPLTLLCYNTSKSNGQNCAVQYQMDMNQRQPSIDPCMTDSGKEGQCPVACQEHLQKFANQGIGCCFENQSQDTSAYLSVNYYKNLKSCLPSLKDPCGRSVLPTSTTKVPPSESSIEPHSNATASKPNVPKPRHKSSSSNVGLIAGVVVTAVVIIVVVVVIVIVRRLRKGKGTSSDVTEGGEDEPDWSYTKLTNKIN